MQKAFLVGLLVLITVCYHAGGQRTVYFPVTSKAVQPPDRKEDFWIFGMAGQPVRPTGDPVVTAGFPGGNIRLVSIAEDTIRFAPDLAGTEGEWFYWNFRVSNVAGRTLTFQNVLENQFTTFGPAMSINDDKHWEWLGEGRVKNGAFTVTFSPRDTSARFCTAIPYTGSNLDEFLERLPPGPAPRVQTLAISREGRKIESLLFPASTRDPVHRVLLTARHHACEMMASFVLEGIMEGISLDPELSYLREHVEFLVVPFMDKDGVENGEQGKNRIPRDHNRDYEGASLYASTSALRDSIPGWSDGKLALALDLHCPWIRGEYNEWIYLVGSAEPAMEREQSQFSGMIEKHNTGELKFRSQDFLPYNTAWNTGDNTSKGETFARWAGSIEPVRLATTVEFPYGNILGTPVTMDNAREFGRSLARAINEYLQAISLTGRSAGPIDDRYH